MCPSHFCRVRVTSALSQSHLKFFRVESETWLGRVESESSHKNVESFRVIGLQTRVNVESHEISHFFLLHFLCYEMAPDKLENGAQHAIKWRPIG